MYLCYMYVIVVYVCVYNVYVCGYVVYVCNFYCLYMCKCFWKLYYIALLFLLAAIILIFVFYVILNQVELKLTHVSTDIKNVIC